jgi:hypothetical protein
MVWCIQNDLDFEKAEALFHIQRVPYIDDGTTQIELEELPSPRVFKTHLPIKYLPENLNNKVKVCQFFLNKN